MRPNPRGPRRGIWRPSRPTWDYASSSGAPAPSQQLLQLERAPSWRRRPPVLCSLFLRRQSQRLGFLPCRSGCPSSRRALRRGLSRYPIRQPETRWFRSSPHRRGAACERPDDERPVHRNYRAHYRPCRVSSLRRNYVFLLLCLPDQPRAQVVQRGLNAFSVLFSRASAKLPSGSN